MGAIRAPNETRLSAHQPVIAVPFARPLGVRRTLVGALFAVFLLGLFGTLVSNAEAQSAQPHIAVVTVDGAIDPVSADYLSRALDVAAEREASLILVLLDTPGGLLDSTREMVKAIFASPAPVVVYTWPAGAQAASAGTFILAAGHVAAMAPSTNVGAASPVGPGGADLPDTLASKATQDAAAFLRSIAGERNRNADALEVTVLDAVSYTASEALELGVVDIVASGLEDLLAQLEGRSVEVNGSSHVLEVEGLPTVAIDRNLLERFLGVIANPNIALLLLSIGGFGILIEFYNPGGWVAGIFGLIALALAFVALGNLPVNWTGFGLIALGMVLFFVEVQAPGLSVPGIAGGIAFVLGAFLLFGGFSPPALDGPSFRVSMWVLVGIALTIAAVMTLLVRTSLQARLLPQEADRQEIAATLGELAVAVTALDPSGTVNVLGEEWSAVSDAEKHIEAGESVLVTETEGLMLHVKRASDETPNEK
jgi:membrane-bound serine protease (ClpP class)